MCGVMVPVALEMALKTPHFEGARGQVEGPCLRQVRGQTEHLDPGQGLYF